jgi:hypothetical protein
MHRVDIISFLLFIEYPCAVERQISGQSPAPAPPLLHFFSFPLDLLRSSTGTDRSGFFEQPHAGIAGLQSLLPEITNQRQESFRFFYICAIELRLRAYFEHTIISQSDNPVNCDNKMKWYFAQKTDFGIAGRVDTGISFALLHTIERFDAQQAEPIYQDLMS